MSRVVVSLDIRLSVKNIPPVVGCIGSLPYHLLLQRVQTMSLPNRNNVYNFESFLAWRNSFNLYEDIPFIK